MSINPGATISPAASNIFASLAVGESFPAAAISAMRSPSSSTSMTASVLVAGSRTRPFLMRSMRGVLYFLSIGGVLLICGSPVPRRWRLGCLLRVILGTSSRKQKQQCHAHRDAVGHLLQHARLRAIGNLRRNLNAAIQRPRVKHDRVGLGMPHALRTQLIQQNIVVQRKRRFMQSLVLHA